MSEGNLVLHELNSAGTYDDNSPPIKETAFQKEIKLKKKELGRNYGHNAFYYKYSSAVDFVNLKRNDPEARVFFPGSYVWVADKEKLYEPAKVISTISYSKVKLEVIRKAKKKHQTKPKRGDLSNVRKLIKTSNSNPIKEETKEDILGQVVMQDGKNLLILNVNAKAAKHLIPMRPEHLNPSNHFDVNIDDLSSASIMYNLRYQFETMDESCLLVGNKTLICLNRFLTRQEEYMREVEKRMALREQTSNKIPREPTLNVKSFAETIFKKLNSKGGSEPQSCIITGNHNSNRRNVTQEFTTKIAQLSQAKDANWFGKLQAADEILSIFGGENFMRWTELHMKYKRKQKIEGDENQGKLIGAAFQSFLLNTSNLVNIDTNSFSVFHQMCEAARHMRKQLEIKEETAKAKSLPQHLTWKQKQQAKQRAHSEQHETKRSVAKKKLEELDFVSDLGPVFKIDSLDKYYYLNNGQLPKFLFSQEEIDEYFEDPEVKKKRLEAELRAKEEKDRLERENALAKKKAIAVAKEKEAEELELKNQKDIVERKRRAEEIKKNKIKPRVDVTTIGRADKNKYLQSMAETNAKHKKSKRLCTQAGCDSNRMGTELFCTKHFFEQSKAQNAAATIIAVGKKSGAVSEHMQSKSHIVEKTQGTLNSIVQNAVPIVTHENYNEDNEIKRKVRINTEEHHNNLDTEDDVSGERVSEDEVDAAEPWRKTVENLKNLDIQNTEIASMINILRDILEIGNILVCNTERKDGKKKLIEVVDIISDDEKDEDLVEKTIDADEIYSPKKKVKTKALKRIPESDGGKGFIKDVAVDFLVEKKLIRKSLFGVKLLDLVTVLNVRKLKIGNEEYLKPLGRNKCLARRDALARSLYAGMFNWLLSIINRGVSFTSEAAKEPKKKSENINEQIGIIAILEAVGLVTELDRLNSNSLEQLINNYGQEKLHSFQTIHILEEHAKIYKKNGLTVPFTEGNELVLPLILGQTKFFEEGIREQNKKLMKKNRASFSRTFAGMNSKIREAPKGPQNKFQKNKKTLGILDICEEQFRAPKGNDKNLIERIMKEHKLHQNMLISKSRYAFKIQHFGAKVNYHVKGFVKKAWSSVLDDEVRDFMINNTRDKLVKKLLVDHSTSRQQKRMEKIYETGMQQIRLGLAVEKLENSIDDFNMEPEGPLIFSRHSVNVRNSRVKREDLVTPNMKPSLKKKKNRSSVSRGLTGMTMTLNLAGLTRARNATNVGKPSNTSSMQSVPLNNTNGDSSGPKHLKYSGARTKHKGNKARASTSVGVRTVFNTMKTLIVMLDLTEPHFIHCISTNEKQIPNELDLMYTYEQLKIAGIIPFFAHRFKNSSFGTGVSFEVFKRQFYPINFIVKPENRHNPSHFLKNVQDLGAIGREDWKIGNTGDRIFLKLGSLGDIETLSDTCFQDIVIFIQKYWRMGLTRKLYFVLLQEKYENLIEKGNSENDLSLLTTVVGKANFFKIKPSNLYLANGKIKRLRAELILRKKLKNVTETGSITEIYAVLNEAKDAHLPRCAEFIAAIERYKKLDSAANQTAHKAQENLKKNFLPVMKEMETRRKESEEWEKEGQHEFMREIEILMKKLEEEKTLVSKLDTKPTMLDKFFNENTKPRNEGTTKNRNRNTVRFGTFKDIKQQANFNGLDGIALVDEADSVDLEDEIDDKHNTPYASGRDPSRNGSVASSYISSTGDQEEWDENEGKQVTKGFATTELKKYNKMIKGRSVKNEEGAPKRASSFFNIFSKRKYNEESTRLKSNKTFGFSFKGFLNKFSTKNRKKKLNSAITKRKENSIRDHLDEESVRKTQNESWDLMSDDSIIRVDIETDENQNNVQPKIGVFSRIKSSFLSVRGSFRGSFVASSYRKSEIEEVI